MHVLKEANKILKTFEKIVNKNKVLAFDSKKGYKVGVDLGTSSIVLAVLDSEDQPVYGTYEFADVIKDGLVVNYHQSIEIVRHLKEQAEEAMDMELTSASGAVPPGTVGNNKNVVANVIESAGFEPDQLVDEPTAAARLLHIEKGAVVDIGGGTTGISVFENGKPIYVTDEPTGGTHMTLVIAGFFKEKFEAAEQRKRNSTHQQENFAIIRPVVQRMAEITRQALTEHPSEPLYVVGGAAYFDEFEKEFEKYLGQPVYKPVFPQFVTPIGIAMSSNVITTK